MIAETAVSMLPWPEIITTGRSGCSLLDDVEQLQAVEPAALQPDVEEDEVRPARVRWRRARRRCRARCACRSPRPAGCRRPVRGCRLRRRRSECRTPCSARSCLLSCECSWQSTVGVAAATGSAAKRSRIQAPRAPGDLVRRRRAVRCRRRAPRGSCRRWRGRGRCPSRASSRRARAAGCGSPSAGRCRCRSTSMTMSSPSRAALTPMRPRAELVRRHGGDRLGRVLDDVGERLRDQPAVEVRRHRVFRQIRPRCRCRGGRPASGTRPGARCRRRPRRRSPASACARSARTRRPCAGCRRPGG